VTLIELLVVIALITLLMTLFFPAVQASRDRAYRASCANNLRQIGTAFQLHHDAFGYFPTGGNEIDPPRTPGARGADQAWGWAYQILPYVEQTALWEDPDDAAVKAKAVETYFCSSRRAPTVFDVVTSKSTGKRAKIDYAACGGTDDHGKDGLIVRSNYNDPVSGEAIKTTPVRLPGSVPDGASNTLLVGERYMNPTWYGVPTGPESDEYRGGYITGMAGRLRFLVRSGDMQPVHDRTYQSPEDFSRFGSRHPESFNAVFADGALHPIRYSVSIEVLRRACRRDDGQAFDVGSL
jgi:type II secretory pathway pseudopilin PulG